MRLALDAHADTAQRMLDLDEALDDPRSVAQVSLRKARQGGLGAQILSIWVDPSAFSGEAAWPRTQALVGTVHRAVATSHDVLALARTGTDIRRNEARDVFSLLMGLEGAHALGADGGEISVRLARLCELLDRGVRYVAVTWSNSNDFGGSSGDEQRSRGLSPAGYDLAETCLSRHALLDVSHASDATFVDLAALAISHARPLCASHSSARALARAPRNLTDPQLRAIADTGGVASVNYYPAFLDDDFRARGIAVTGSPEGRRAIADATRKYPDHPGRASLEAHLERARLLASLTSVSIERVVDHIMHMRDVAGEDAVGLGSDFDGITAVPEGLEDASCLPHLADALTRRGLPAPVVEKIFADNWLRVLDA
jgi:membrane dipeptidase